MDVLTAAWTGRGTPGPPAAGAAGVCARCGAVGRTTPASEAVSKTFTAFDEWVAPSGRGLCHTCLWGYTTPVLRAEPHLVTRTPPCVQQLERGAAAGLLQKGALATGSALVVPLRPGRKHVMPNAVWGRVTVDNAALPWTERDATLLRLVSELRSQGFGSRMLAEPTPPFAVLKSLPTTSWANVMRSWEQLAAWRAADSPWLPLALYLTTTPTKEVP